MPVDLVRAERVAVDLAGWAVRELVRSAGADSCVVRTTANPADLFTPVDERIERQARTVLGREFPGYGVIGEELPPRSRAPDRGRSRSDRARPFRLSPARWQRAGAKLTGQLLGGAPGARRRPGKARKVHQR